MDNFIVSLSLVSCFGVSRLPIQKKSFKKSILEIVGATPKEDPYQSGFLGKDITDQV